MKRYKTNLFDFFFLWNESTKRIFWTPYRFTNPNPKNSYGFVLFIVRLCTKDSSGFVRIRWIRENRSNLWKFRSRNESTIWIFKNRTRESGFANPWSQDSWHDTKRIFLGSGFVTTIRNESMDLRNESTFLRISYTNPASLNITQFRKKYWKLLFQC